MLPTVQVPLVTQLLYDDAMVRLNNVGLDVVTIVREVPLDSPTVGQVTDQQPAAYEEVDVGSTVTITVDQVPTVAIPNVIGFYYDDAVAQLNLLGFAIRTTSTRYTVGVNVGEVYWQSPEAFEVVPEGSYVDIKVGGSPPTTTTTTPPPTITTPAGG